MNKIRRIGEQKWEIMTEDKKTFTCGEWFEKKTGEWHVKLPSNNPTGRTYIRVKNLPSDGSTVEFETKTTHRENLGWSSRMTEEEKKVWEECEKKMAEIKKACEERAPEKLERNSKEWLEAEIARLTAKLAQKK